VRIGLLMIVALATACRYGFHDQPDAAADSPPDGPGLLSCAPKRFTIGGTITHLAAAATSRGYTVFVADEHGAIRGFAYDLAGDTLEPQTGTGTTLSVPAAVGPIGAIAVEATTGDSIEVMLAVPYGIAAPPEANGTALIPFDAHVARVDVPKMQDDWLAGAGMLASGDGGTIAYLGIAKSNGALETQSATRLGSGSSTVHPIDTKGHSVTRPTIIRAASGYLVSWEANGTMPTNELDAAVIGDSLDARPPQTINADPLFSSLVPAAGYSAQAKKYLFAWAEKRTSDVIKLRLRDDQLADAPGPIDLVQTGYAPKIVAGDRDFVVAWDAAGSVSGPPGAARVAPDGSFVVRGVTNTGGKAQSSTWDLVVRFGQPALIWVEQGGSGPDLWIDALCDY
jgi:hypothetical protein